MATLQLGSERVNPGGTLDLLGDMTAEGSVEITLVADADASTRLLGTVEADRDGHFRSFLTVPGDLAGGSYSVIARTATEEARAPIVIAGTQIAGEEGQQPGQDEAFVGGASPPPAGGSPAAIAATPRSLAPAQPSQPANQPMTVLVVAIAVTGAIFVGGVARTRARRDRPNGR